MATTRTEITDHVTAAFERGPASRADLLAVADLHDAPQDVVEQLQRLPEATYSNLRQLWPELPGLPIA